MKIARLIACGVLAAGCTEVSPPDPVPDPTDPPACTAGERICKDDMVVECDSEETIVEICGLGCEAGACLNTCEAAEAIHSNVGCEFWAADLDNVIEVGPAPDEDGLCSSIWTGTSPVDDLPVCVNGTGGIGGECDHGGDCSSLGGTFACETTAVCALDAQHAPFAVVVANPDRQHAVDVTIEIASGLAETVSVPAGEVVPIYPQQLGFPDQSLDHTSLSDRAYRVTSDRPIIAYQFNPLEDVGVFSNDASLLLPAHTLDRVYYGASLPTYSRGGPARDNDGYLTIVATSPGTTSVTVAAAGRVRAGGIPTMNAGELRSFSLPQFSTLTLAADGSAPGDPEWDLSGTRIEADHPIAVFGGHEAASVEDAGNVACCLDHLEEQLLPASTWGERYAVTRSQQRSLERDRVRIVAQRAGTTVQFSPAPFPESCPVLDAGAYCDVYIEVDTEITANEPILVTQLLTAVPESGEASGDPSMAVVTPAAQFRTTYSFLVPDRYAHHYVSVSAALGAPVTLDGQDITNLLVPFGSNFAGARIPVYTGQHTVTCPAGCGLMVYGWSHKVSYMYAGGLDLDPIVVD